MTHGGARGGGTLKVGGSEKGLLCICCDHILHRISFGVLNLKKTGIKHRVKKTSSPILDPNSLIFIRITNLIIRFFL